MSRLPLVMALAGSNARDPQADGARRQLGDVLYGREKYPDVEAVVRRMAQLTRRYSSRPKVRNLAVRITRRITDMKRPQPIAEAVHRWVRDNIRYVLDPDGVELLQSPDRVLRAGYADCDGMSVLAAGLLSAVGVRSGFEIIAQRRPEKYDHVYVVYRRRDGSVGRLDSTRPHLPGPNPNPRILSRKTFWISDMQPTATTLAGPVQHRGLGQANDELQKQSSIQTTGGNVSWENVLVETINTAPDLVQAFRMSPQEYAEAYNTAVQSGGAGSRLPARAQQATIMGMKPSEIVLTGGALVAGLWALNRFLLD